MSASGWRDRPRQRSTPPPRKTRQPWEAEEVALLKQLYEEHMPETAAQWISVAEQLGTGRPWLLLYATLLGKFSTVPLDEAHQLRPTCGRVDPHRLQHAFNGIGAVRQRGRGLRDRVRAKSLRAPPSHRARATTIDLQY